MKPILHLALLILFSAGFLYAQSDSPKCPTFYVEGPSAPLNPGVAIPFRVVVSKDFDSSNLKYKWSVLNGKILSGQGTTSIFIDSSGLESRSPVATVLVEGLPEGCPNTASEAGIPFCGVIPYKVDEYEKMSDRDEKIRLNDFSQALLQSDRNATGHFRKVFQHGLTNSAAYRNLRQILNYLKSRGIDENRLTFGLAFGEKELTSIFIVPTGAETPFEIDDEILKASQLTEKLKTIKTNSSKSSRRTN